MITIRLSADDVSRIRFAFAPVWEAVTSVRVLSRADSGLHRPWVRRIQPMLAGSNDLELLQALIPADGYIPDFLTPTPQRRSAGLESGLAAIASTPPDVLAEELRTLRQWHPSPLLDDLIAGPAEAPARIVTALRNYWRIAVEPDWRRIRALLQEDLAHRLEELASGGVHRLFRTLHPSVTFTGDRVQIARPFTCHGSPLPGQGLVLVPCVFAWPSTLSIPGAPYVPTLTYPPRGVGLLWESRPESTTSPLADLIGKTRAAIVSQLDLPMSTTQLSAQLNLSAPTLSVHLGILRSAGVIASRRDGRTVLYRRTPLGNHLLIGLQTGLSRSA